MFNSVLAKSGPQKMIFFGPKWALHRNPLGHRSNNTILGPFRLHERIATPLSDSSNRVPPRPKIRQGHQTARFGLHCRIQVGPAAVRGTTVLVTSSNLRGRRTIQLPGNTPPIVRMDGFCKINIFLVLNRRLDNKKWIFLGSYYVFTLKNKRIYRGAW